MEREEETLEMLDEEEEERFQETCSAYVAAVASYIALDQFEDGPKGRTSGSKNVKRERVPVETIFANLGPRLLKKCYRMPEILFWKLDGLLTPYMRDKKKRKRGSTPCY